MLRIFPWWANVIIALAAVAAVVLAYNLFVDHIGDKREAIVVARYDAAIADQKIKAAAQLANETARVEAVEDELVKFKNAQEIKDVQNTKTITGLRFDLRTAAGSAGRLRDPNAAPGCRSSGDSPNSKVATGSSSSPDDAAEGGGLLSKELTGFLLDQAASADEINVAYTACRADTFKVRESLVMPK